MSNGRALIIGGSVGGLFAAHFLRAEGWDVTVFERSASDLADRGASIGTREELFQAMRRVGISLDASVGVSVRARICLDARGAIQSQRPTASVTSAWDRVYRPLRAALPESCYRPGMRLDRVEPQSSGVAAVFADGTREAGDLLIAADGIHSTVRAQFLPGVEPRYAGYVGWRGVIEESALTAEEHALLFGRMTFCLPAGELVLALGMPGRDADTRPGRRRYYWIWFRAADRDRVLPDLCTDESGKCHGSSIPPHLVRADILRALREAADRSLAPQLAAIVRRTPQPFPHGIFDLESPRIVFGRVALLGDAAFVARPHVGAGVTKAALDAQGLAEALRGSADLPSALSRYESERSRFGRFLVSRARRLGAYLEAHAMPHDASAGPLPERRVEEVLLDYGTAGMPP